MQKGPDKTAPLEAPFEVPALDLDVDETARLLRKRRLIRWLSRGFVLAIAAVGLAALHIVAPDLLSLGTACWTGGALLVGLLAADFRFVPTSEPDTVTEVVTHDLARLEQCFAILQKQVSVTIRTSEHAVLETVSRLHSVHKRSADLHEHISAAVSRSRHLSEASQHEADGNRATVSTLASSQEAFVRARRENQERIRHVVEQVRHLTPLASLISDISRQTNLLAINASIEAARAGAEGAGFKVVAAEVRRLSSQTSEAANKISAGIQSVAATIEGELATASELDADGGAASQLTEVATHIAQISASLNEVVPYLVDLSNNMNDGMQVITTDIIDAMGHMQFQDINRQLLEQVESALGSLSEHSAQLYALVGGNAPPPPEALEHLMERWVEGYVMEEQRIAHQAIRAMGTQRNRKGGAAPDAQVIEQRTPISANDVQIAEPQVPKIELF